MNVGQAKTGSGRHTSLFRRAARPVVHVAIVGVALAETEPGWMTASVGRMGMRRWRS
jgi:hypothetical protein